MSHDPHDVPVSPPSRQSPEQPYDALSPEPLGEPDPALGTVLEVDRGSLPFALLHGESLVATASWALGEAGVTLLDLGTGWPGLQESGEALVLHDALCPATPPGFLATCVRTAQDADVVVVGARPVTDTVKAVEGGLAGGAAGATHDRDELVVVTSPVALPAGVVAALDGLPSTDLAALVDALRGAGHEVRFLAAPAEGRRVSSEDDLAVLEALTAPSAT